MSSRKMRRTSPVWDYFRRQEDGKITCNICKKDLANGGQAKYVDEAKKCFGKADTKQPLMLSQRSLTLEYALLLVLLVSLS